MNSNLGQLAWCSELHDDPILPGVAGSRRCSDRFGRGARSAAGRSAAAAATACDLAAGYRGSADHVSLVSLDRGRYASRRHKAAERIDHDRAGRFVQPPHLGAVHGSGRVPQRAVRRHHRLISMRR